MSTPTVGTVGAAHTTFVSIGVMVMVIVILVTLAGQGHYWALGVGALLLSAVLLAGFRDPSGLNALSQYPRTP